MAKHWTGQHQSLHPNAEAPGQSWWLFQSLLPVWLWPELVNNSPPQTESGSSSISPLILSTSSFMPCFNNFTSSSAFQQANCCSPVSWLDNCMGQAAASLLCSGICWLKQLPHAGWPQEPQLPLLLMRSTCWWVWSLSQLIHKTRGWTSSRRVLAVQIPSCRGFRTDPWRLMAISIIENTASSPGSHLNQN